MKVKTCHSCRILVLKFVSYSYLYWYLFRTCYDFNPNIVFTFSYTPYMYIKQNLHLRKQANAMAYCMVFSLFCFAIEIQMHFIFHFDLLPDFGLSAFLRISYPPLPHTPSLNIEHSQLQSNRCMQHKPLKCHCSTQAVLSCLLPRLLFFLYLI